jgi:hypothetical protein
VASEPSQSQDNHQEGKWIVNKRGVLWLVAVIAIGSGVAWAGPMEDAAAASQKGNHAEAIRILTALAEKGDLKAQVNSGGMYYNGQGTPQDLAQARAWFEKAAAQGDPLAQNNLGAMYHKGKGVARDLAQARAWYEKAAAQGNPQAQEALGEMYATGQGAPQDLAQARAWFEKGATQGHPAAQMNLGVLYGNGQGVAKDLAQARAWWEKAAAQSTDPETADHARQMLEILAKQAKP